MDKQAIEQALKEDLGVVKELVALKPLKAHSIEYPPVRRGCHTRSLCPGGGSAQKRYCYFIPPGKITSAMKD